LRYIPVFASKWTVLAPPVTLTASTAFSASASAAVEAVLVVVGEEEDERRVNSVLYRCGLCTDHNSHAEAEEAKVKAEGGMWMSPLEAAETMTGAEVPVATSIPSWSYTRATSSGWGEQGAGDRQVYIAGK